MRPATRLTFPLFALVALLLGPDGFAGGGEDFLAVGDAGAAELLHDQ